MPLRSSSVTRLHHRLGRELDLLQTRRETQFLRRLPAMSSDGSVLLVSMSNRAIVAKTLGLLGMRLQAAGLRPVVLTSPELANAIRVYRLFGLTEFQPIDPRAVARREVMTSERAAELCEEDLLSLRYRGVSIGRTALNTLLRERLLGSVNFADAEIRERVRQLLAASAGLVDEAERLLSRLAPSVALFQSDRGYSPVGELFGTCLTLGIPAIPITPAHRGDAFVLKRYTLANQFESPFSLADETWSGILEEEWSEADERAVMELLVSSYEDANWYANVYERRDRRIAEGTEVRRQLGIESHRRVGVIFPHILWDAAFFYGWMLFPNYESWLVETLRAAGKTSEMDWVVRFHPAYVTQQKRADLDRLEDLAQFRRRLGAVPGNVHFIDADEDLSALALLRLADVCVTGQGTVGIEAPCHGVPTVTAATGRYSGRGFTIDPESREEYLDWIANAAEISPLNQETVTRARRFAHVAFLRRPWTFSSFALSRRPLERLGHPLDRNLRLKVSTVEEFLAAEDLRRFAEWVVGSDAEDYLQ